MWGPQTQQLGGRVWAPTLEESCPPGGGGDGGTLGGLQMG